MPLSELSAFFRPPAGAAEATIAAAVSALPSLSTGELTSPLLTIGNDGTPYLGGPMSPRGWGHVRMAGAVVHRALGSVIAHRLGWTEDEVWSVVTFDAWIDGGRARPLEGEADPRFATSGPEALRPLLGDAPGLLLDIVPVTPPATRLVVDCGAVRVPHLASIAYQDLVFCNLQLRHIKERTAIPGIIALHHQQLQMAFDALCARLGGEPGPRIAARRRGWVFATGDRYWHRVPPPAVVLATPPDDMETDGALLPSGCAFLDADTAPVCGAGAARVISLTTGTVRASHALPSLLRLVAPTPDGRVATFSLDGELFALDLERGDWLPDAPGAPLAAIAERAERALLVDARRNVTAYLPEVVDYVAWWAASADGRLLWVEDRSGRGGVYSVETGLRVLDRVAWTENEPTVPLIGEELADDVSLASAFAMTADGRWRFLDLGVLVVDRTPSARLGFPASAAAFDAAGEHLLLAAAGELLVVAVGPPPRIVQRLPVASAPGA